MKGHMPAIGCCEPGTHHMYVTVQCCSVKADGSILSITFAQTGHGISAAWHQQAPEEATSLETGRKL